MLDHRQNLIEQYDDAVFALLMDDHAQESGEELLHQFQAAVDVGLVPEMPEALDRLCAEAIESEFRRRRSRARLQRLLCGAVNVALGVFYLFRFLFRRAAALWRKHRNRYDLHWERIAQEAPELAPEALEDISHPIFLTV